MKKLHFITCILLFFLASCAKSKNEFAYSGTLTGPDMTQTACSGGVFFKTGTKLYHIDSLPGMKNEDFYKLNFPVAIECNGNPTGKCTGMAQDGYFYVTTYKF